MLDCMVPARLLLRPASRRPLAPPPAPLRPEPRFFLSLLPLLRLLPRLRELRLLPLLFQLLLLPLLSTEEVRLSFDPRDPRERFDPLDLCFF